VSEKWSEPFGFISNVGFNTPQLAAVCSIQLWN